MNRWVILSLIVLTTVVAAVVVGAVRLIDNDREAIVARLAADRRERLDEAIKHLDEDLVNIREDLLFAGQAIEASGSIAEQERQLQTIVEVGKPYRAVRVHDAARGLIAEVRDRRFTASARVIDEAMAQAARRALAAPAGEIQTTPPLALADAGLFRIFATGLPSRPGAAPARAVTMLVDTQPLFGKLRLLVSPPGSQLLLLGTHGQPTAASDPQLVDAVGGLEPGSAGDLARVVDRMRRGEAGAHVIGAREAAGLGFGEAEVGVAYAPVQSRGKGHWSIALFGSTAALREQEQGIILRLGLAAGLIVLCLVAFGAYVVVAARRAVAARERLRHAEHLAHLHEKTEKVLENVPTGVLVLGEDGRITFLNRTLRERLPGPTIGADLAAALPRAPHPVVLELRLLIDAALSSEQVESLFGRRLSLFGEEGQYNVHAVPLERRFPDARLVLVLEDLSEVRSLESQLVRAEKLATLGVISAGIAHEIGTPLGVVRGRAEFLLSKLGSDHPQAGGVGVIVEQIDRVTRTIRQLLDFSRVSPPRVRPVALAPVAEAVGELLRYEVAARKLSLAMDVPGALTPVSADPDQLQQVLVNLLMNACDACKPGGSVRVEARPEPASRLGTVRIDVADDGCGIPEAQRAQVFDPFFTTKKRGQGTGLGLPIVAQIVRNHGGEIEVESVPGAGTRVTVHWPSAGPEEAHGAAG